MAGAAPFFITPATLGTAAATASTTKSKNKSSTSSGSKRKASVVEESLLRGSIEDLVTSTGDTVVPLSVRRCSCCGSSCLCSYCYDTCVNR